MISKNNVKLCSARLSVVVVLISSKPWIIIIKQYDKTIIRFSFCYIWNNQNRDKCYQQKLAVSEFRRPLYHNQVKCSTFDMAMIFHSHEKNPFSQERLYTWPHFESEGFWTRKSLTVYNLATTTNLLHPKIRVSRLCTVELGIPSGQRVLGYAHSDFHQPHSVAYLSQVRTRRHDTGSQAFLHMTQNTKRS